MEQADGEKERGLCVRTEGSGSAQATLLKARSVERKPAYVEGVWRSGEG